jgi:L-aminopeptidase/D-esterase-like protein
MGSVIDPGSGLPWLSSAGLRRPGRDERRALRDAVAPAPPSLNTTIGVVCTDADITRPEAGRLAMSAHDGLARAIRPAHLLMDGDTIFALSTTARAFRPADCAADCAADSADGPRAATSRAAMLSTLFAAGADVFGSACTDAVLSASTISARLAYRDLCPSAFARVADAT